MIENESVQFKVDIENYNGPLDILLDLAKAQKVNLEIASEYLLMATWLAYLKSKLLLPGTPEEEFKVQEVAEKLKLQLKKLELIRLLSDQMLKRKRLGREIRFRGSRPGIKPIYNSELKVNLFELLKTYSTIIMTKDFQRINIPKLPVFTTEEGIKTIKEFFGKLIDWKKLNDLIPKNMKEGAKYKSTGKAGIFAGSLELVKEGSLRIKQDKLYDDIYIKEKISKKTDVEKALLKLQSEYSNRGINLVCISKKWSFRTSPNLSKLMIQEKTIEKKLSRAAIETLAIIVYHQPVTRAEIEEIRGVAFGTNTLEILMELNWVKPGGRKDVPGKPIQYITTDDFLSHFNLQKLSDLPTVDELGAAGLIDSTNIDNAIFGTGKFYKEKRDENKEDIYSNIDEMLSSTLDSDDNK